MALKEQSITHPQERREKLNALQQTLLKWTSSSVYNKVYKSSARRKKHGEPYEDDSNHEDNGSSFLEQKRISNLIKLSTSLLKFITDSRTVGRANEHQETCLSFTRQYVEFVVLNLRQHSHGQLEFSKENLKETFLCLKSSFTYAAKLLNLDLTSSSEASPPLIEDHNLANNLFDFVISVEEYLGSRYGVHTSYCFCTRHRRVGQFEAGGLPALASWGMRPLKPGGLQPWRVGHTAKPAAFTMEVLSEVLHGVLVDWLSAIRLIYGFWFDYSSDQIHDSMENTIIPDDVLCNILSQLSAKPLMRFRCVSKHWNSVITDPYFIKSISHRRILIPSGLTGLYAFNPKYQKIVKLTYPFENQIHKCNVIGTLNGILLLVLEKYFYGLRRIFILYNPLTRATEKLPDLPHPCCHWDVMRCAYGFCHGNIITIKYPCDCHFSSRDKYCNIFSLKNSSWTVQKTTFTCYDFVHRVGIFLNGFLHWVAFGYDDLDNLLEIVVLDVTEMVAMRMDAPRLTIDCYNAHTSVLGTLHGCLCMSFMWRNGFDVWVKEHSEWSKQYSFVLPFYRYGCPNRLDVTILEDGRILVKDEVSNQIILCHLFEHYYEIFKCANEIRVTSRMEYDEYRYTHLVGKPFEYVESLAMFGKNKLAYIE
ncbi:hypothetical protein OSB04_007469, partial [Centaurea solstitialis]